MPASNLFWCPFKGISIAVLALICEIPGSIAYNTGEIILYAITCGRHKPKLQEKESIVARELHAILSTWI